MYLLWDVGCLYCFSECMTIKIRRQCSSKKSKTDCATSNSKSRRSPTTTISTPSSIKEYTTNTPTTGRSQTGPPTKMSTSSSPLSHTTNQNTIPNASPSSPTSATSPLCCRPKTIRVPGCSSVLSLWGSMRKCSARICRNPRRSSCASWRKIPIWVTMNRCTCFMSSAARGRVRRGMCSYSWARWRRVGLRCIPKRRGCRVFCGWWRSRRVCVWRVGGWRTRRTWWQLSWKSDISNICGRIGGMLMSVEYWGNVFGRVE